MGVLYNVQHSQFHVDLDNAWHMASLTVNSEPRFTVNSEQ